MMVVDSCTSEQILGLIVILWRFLWAYRAVPAFRTLRVDSATTSSWLICAGKHFIVARAELRSIGEMWCVVCLRWIRRVALQKVWEG